MKRKCFIWPLMVRLLLVGVFVWTIPTNAQQLKTNNETLDLNYKKVEPFTFNGSAFTIDGASLRNMPASNLENLLTGLIPGFYSRQNSGNTNDEKPDIWIRGRRSTNEGVLVLIDGQERDINSITVFEVDKITILKDASAVVFYGMRAANGAILITTRKGEKGKPRLEFTTQLVQQQALKIPTAVNAYDYTRLYNEAYKNDNPSSVTPPYAATLYQNSATPELYPNVNWVDDYYRKNQLMQKYNLNLYGGSDHTRYFVNAGILTDQGNFKTDANKTYSTDSEFKRYNLRSNFEVDVTPTTLLNVNVNGYTSTQNEPNGDMNQAFNAIMNTPASAFTPFLVDNGLYKDQLGQSVIGKDGKIIRGNALETNPWALINSAGYGITNSIYGSLQVKLEQDLSVITKGLKASGEISMDSYAGWRTNRTKTFAFYEPAGPNILKKTNTDGTMRDSADNKMSNHSTTVNLQLSYNRKFNQHSVSAAVFYNTYEGTNDVSIPSRYQGVGGLFSYNFADRYGIDLMADYQGSYKFAKQNQYGLFPTVALGWTISNEPFFEKIKPLISHLKLRGSIGQIGNDRGVPAFNYLSSLQAKTNVYNFGNTMGAVAGYSQTQVSNPDFTWENALITNLALEANMFSNRLTVIAECFRDQRTNTYVTNQLIGSLYGIRDTIQQNIGKMYSQGTDISIQWNSKIGDFTYNIGGTYSYSMNEIQDNGEATKAWPWLYDKGYPVGVPRGLEFAGFFNSMDEINDPLTPKQTFSAVKPGDIRYVDQNKDGIIDANDIVPIGYGNCPQHFFSINLGAEYKGFGLTVLFQGAANVSRVLTNTSYGRPFFNNGTVYENQLNYWSQTNMENAEFPALSLANVNGSNNMQNSTVWTRNADYIRLKTAQIYYNLSSSLLKGSIISGAQFYLSGYDLITWDKLKIIDPEFDPSGASFPITRNICIGFTLKF